MVDTGAAVSLLRKDIWDLTTSTNPPDLQPWPGQSLVTVDGFPLTVYGRATIPVKFGSHKVDVTFAIAEGLTAEAILGLDFLNQCTLDLKNCTLTLADSTTLPLTSEESPSTGQLAVSVTKTLHIPAASELEVIAHVIGATSACTYLLEQIPNKRLPVVVARALVTPISLRGSCSANKPCFRSSNTV